MNDLDTLRPEVMEAAAKLDDFDSAFGTGGHWQIIRAELLRLQSTESRANEWQLRAEKAEAELAALKARMKPCAQVVGGEVRALMDPDDEGKYVAVVVVEE